MTRFNKLRAFVAVAAMSAASGAFAADIDMNADANDVAISGYDPVAYFSDSEATKGSAEYTATYKTPFTTSQTPRIAICSALIPAPMHLSTAVTAHSA